MAPGVTSRAPRGRVRHRRCLTLRAGDVLLTGTPSGIGNARVPQIFLGEGDLVVTRVSGLGTLRNRVATANLAAASTGI
jgi:2-keto-4-pentenoate hydratase/2-oxohepta-3-ene-1,7-dioic acid hydratase in catechol pathway